MIHPLRVYGDCLLSPGEAQGNIRIRLEDGTVLPLAIEQYTGPADEIDQRILAGIAGPVLDVGCGPGRHLHVLARRGVFALGVDLSPVAVRLARGGGGNAIVASIFDELPGASAWRSALLLDGNIGIGGCPVRLLQRIATLLASGGEVLAEVGPPGTPTTGTRARLESDRGNTAWFPWARVAAPGIEAIAEASFFELRGTWSDGGRWFARLATKGLRRINVGV